MSSHSVLVVIPAYNEALSVGEVIAEVHEAVPGAHVLVVDDGSRDGTAKIARRAGALAASLPYNLGVGGAMRTGYQYARVHGYDAVVQVDADGQHDPAAIPALLARLDTSDVVLGARFAGEGTYRVRGPRKWAMAVLARILSRICDAKLTDTTSGFRAINADAISVFADHYPAEYLGDTIEALVIAHRCGLTVEQVPVAMRARTHGTPSHNPFEAAVYLARAALALVFAVVRPTAMYESRTA